MHYELNKDLTFTPLNILGGTTDITVHEVSSSGGLKEVHAAGGGGWGGILVDEAYKDLLVDICGKEVYEAFTTEETEDWLDLWRSFEVKKKTVDPNQTAAVHMRIPVTLMTLFKAHKGHDLADSIKNSKFSKNIKLRNDKLICDANLVKGLFDTSIEKTIMHIEKVLGDPKVDKVKAILMVGGLSTSMMLKEAVKSKFGGMAVIIPGEASSAVLRGAVMFGHNPSAISQRVVRYTYGIHATAPFIKGEHKESKKLIIDGEVCCDDIFSSHVACGQTVTVGEAQVELPYQPSHLKQDVLDVTLYASDLENPKYVDESCVLIGALTIDISDVAGSRSDRAIAVSLIYSDTEIKAKVRVKKTGKTVTASFDFLGQ